MIWPRGGLWRHSDFLKLWSGETISQFGTQVSRLALPLAAILVLDASAFEVAALGAVEFLPFLLFALPAGVWVDRLRRRPILIVADLGRAAAARIDPARVLPRRAHDLAALHRRLSRRDVHGLLRRLLPVVPPLARPPRPARRRELAARGDAERRADRRSRARRPARRRASPPRTRSSSTPSASSDPRGLLSVIRTERRRCAEPAEQAEHAARAQGGSCATSSGIATGGRSRSRPRRSNFFWTLSGSIILVYAVRDARHVAGGDRARRSRSARIGGLIGAVHRQAGVGADRRRPDDRARRRSSSARR